MTGTRKPRKLWSAITITSMSRRRFESKTATYQWVRRQADLWNRKVLRSPLITVYVDERDGQGWQTYDRIDLRDSRSQTTENEE